MALSRVMDAEKLHMRIGWLAHSERGQMKAMKTLSTYEANPPLGAYELVGVTASGEGKNAVIYLTAGAAVELAKGLLMNLMTMQGGPITMAADDELRSILKQSVAMIGQQDKESEQVVKAIKERYAAPSPGDAGDPTASG